ncbi:Flagellar biosynthetic protein FliQ [Buchnera aphidicola (Pterocallis alni)]|uniref:flagellar biosynthetic protein FliQ n=1 Tax=Buchnera aphidicola TaxID=9 RepID=UPI00346491F3
MSNELISNIFFESIKVMIMFSAPLLLSILFTGLTVSILQTITQINEYTLSFILKVISIFLVFMFFGSWIVHIIADYMIHVIKIIPSLVFYVHI